MQKPRNLAFERQQFVTQFAGFEHCVSLAFLVFQTVGETRERHLIWVNCSAASGALRQVNMGVTPTA
jgi:hypothetical protein